MQKLQCSCCGGKLTMNADGVATCQFCGMEYAPEAVQKMIVELKGSVQVEGMDTADTLAKRAETFLSLKEIEEAREIFGKLAKQYPDDYRGWWGQTRVLDWDGYFRQNAGKPFEMPVCCQRALQFAPEEKKQEIRAFYEEKAKQVGGRVSANYTDMQQKLAALNAKIKQYESMNDALLKQEHQATVQEMRLSKYGDYRNHINGGRIFVALLLLIIAVALNLFLPHPVSLLVLAVVAFCFLETCYLAIQKRRYRRVGQYIQQIRSRQTQLAREKRKIEEEQKRLQQQKL